MSKQRPDNKFSPEFCSTCDGGGTVPDPKNAAIRDGKGNQHGYNELREKPCPECGGRTPDYYRGVL